MMPCGRLGWTPVQRKFFLNQKNMGKLILLASHNKEDIEMLCDEVYEMNRTSLFFVHKKRDIKQPKEV